MSADDNFLSHLNINIVNTGFLPQVEHVKNERTILKVSSNFGQIKKSPEMRVYRALKCSLPLSVTL